MHLCSRRICALYNVQSDAEPDVNIEAPPIGDGQILTTGQGPLLCTTIDVLKGSQRIDLGRQIGTRLNETLGGWAVDAECCYTGERKRDEETRQLDE